MKTLKKLFKSKKGFSLIELLVVVAIIGVLAAVAIPAYNGYRRNANIATINASLKQIIKAYNACLSVSPPNTCTGGTANTAFALGNSTINGTLVAQPGTTIQASRAANNNTCFIVTQAATTFDGCVGFDANGQIQAQSDDTQIPGTATQCDTSGVCTP